MSLLNDMLKDIDGDEKSPDKSTASALASNVTKQDKRGFILPVVALIAGGFYALVELNIFGIFPERKTASNFVIPEPVKLNSKWLEGGAHIKKEKEAQTELATEPKIAIPKSDQSMAATKEAKGNISSAEAVIAASVAVLPQLEPSESGIQTLLDKADQLIEKKHYTTPASDNALQYLKSVLLLAPQNKAATERLNAIKKEYLHMAERAREKGNVNAAQRYYEKASLTGLITPADIAYFVEQTREPELSVSQSGISGTSDSKKLKPQSDSDLVKSLQAQFDKYETIVLNRLRQGEALPLSTMALSEQYFNKRDRQSITELAQISKNDADVQNVLLAQKKVLDKQYENARALLDMEESSGELNIIRLRLLGATCQKLVDFVCAEQAYSRIMNTTKPELQDWLGLAVASDGVGNSSQAAEAYLQVLNNPIASDRVRQFARARVSELRSGQFKVR